MKSKLSLLILLVLLAGQVEAQGLFRKLGKVVGQAIKSEIQNSLQKRQLKKQQPQQPQQPQQSQQSQQPQQRGNSHSSTSSNEPVANTPVLEADTGQNIKRESGCDYIDEYGINHGGGILIGTVVWAPVNCGYHKTDYPYGKLYQWGRKHGQGYGAPYADPKHNVRPDKTTAELVTAWVTPAEARKHPNRHYFHEKGGYFNWTQNDMQLWNKTETMEIRKNPINDPCPNGWRVADLHDYQELCKHYSEETVYYDGGQKGRWLSGPEPYSTNVPRIFLSMGGYRNLDGYCLFRESLGLYWTDRHGGGEGLVWHFRLEQNGVELYPMAWPHDAYSVRCVRDVPGKMMH